jgi:hypothetical protein
MPSIPSRLKLTLAMIGGTLLTEVLNDLSEFPERYQLLIKISCRTAVALLATANLWKNPDSTDAREPYQPTQPKSLS